MLKYLGYVSSLNGHVMRNDTTQTYELWDKFGKLSESNTMEFDFEDASFELQVAA